MLKVYPGQITYSQMYEAYERLAEVRPDALSTFEDLAKMSDAIVMGWHYRAAPSVWDDCLHAFAWAAVPISAISTECPPTHPFQEKLLGAVDGWSHRELWILSCHIYFGAVLSTPMQGQYFKMLSEYENCVLKKPILEWLLQGVPIHDFDRRVVATGLFLLLWNASSYDLHRYASSCVYNTAKVKNSDDLVLLQMAFSAIVARSSSEQLANLEVELFALREKAEVHGYRNEQFESCLKRASWIVDRALGKFGYR